MVPFLGFHVDVGSRTVHTMLRLKDGTLRSWIQDRGPLSPVLTEEQLAPRAVMAVALVSSLCDLHYRKVPLVHGDIKSDNVLLTLKTRSGTRAGCSSFVDHPLRASS